MSSQIAPVMDKSSIAQPGEGDGRVADGNWLSRSSKGQVKPITAVEPLNAQAARVHAEQGGRQPAAAVQMAAQHRAER
ncbi:MAG TPA: hypothetical protein VGT42_07075, partial [Gammaproteobacteria bacterium]|nr:hypothetical protein [Gammaproteobacteria bacterium]